MPHRRRVNKIEFNDVLIAAAIASVYVIALFFHIWLKRQFIYFSVIEEGFPVAANFPWDMFARECLLDGRFPIWNPYSSGGTVFLGNWLEAFFFFPRWFLYLSRSGLLRDFYVLLRFWTGGIFLFIFLRRIGLKNFGAIIGMMSFLGAGYFTRYYNENYLSIELLIGLWMLAADHLAVRRSMRSMALCVFAIMGILFAGHPTAAFHTLLMMGIFVLYRAGKDFLKVGSMFAAACIIALIGASVQLLTFVESWVYSTNCHIKNLGSIHYELRHLATLAYPWIYGTIDSFLETYNLPQVVGGSNYADTGIFWLPYYFGAAQLLAVGVCLIGLRRAGRWPAFFLAYMIISLGIVFGLDPFRALTAMPLLGEIGNYKHLFCAMTFSAAVAAGKGVELIVFSKRRDAVKLIAPVCAALIALGIYAAFKSPYSGKWNHLLCVGLLPMAGIAIITALKKPRLAAVGIIAIFFVTELSYLRGYRYIDQDYTRRQIVTPYVQYLIKHRNEGRFISLFPPLFPNLGMLWQLSDIHGLDALQPKSYWNKLLDINACDEEKLHKYFLAAGVIGPMPERLDAERLNQLGLKYVVSPGDIGGVVTVRSLSREAAAYVPDSEHFLWSIWDIGGDSRPVIQTHPPAFIELPAGNPAENADIETAIAFNPSTPKGSDGAFMLIIDFVGGKRRVLYCRHLSGDDKKWISVPPLPARPPDEKRFLLIHPGNDVLHDWVGWGYKTVGDEYRGFKLALPGKIAVYKSEAPVRQVTLSDVNGEISDKDPVLIMRFSDEYIIELDSAGRVNLNFLAYRPGWRAFAEEGEKKIIDGRTVDIARKTDLLVLKYTPASFRIGLWVTISTIILCIVGIFVRMPSDKKSVKHRKSSSKKRK